MGVTRAALWLAAILAAGPALAAERLVSSSAEGYPEETRFVPAEHGAHACWNATFDDPAHKVVDMSFAMTFEDIPPNTNEEWPEGRQFFNYQLDAVLNDGTRGTTGGTCRGLEGGGVICEVECDGGGAVVSLDADGDAIVDIERTGFIRMLQCGADGETFSLKPEDGAGQFVLTPVAAEQCSPVERFDYLAGVD